MDVFGLDSGGPPRLLAIAMAWCILLGCGNPAPAAPRFEGIREARPAPRAAALWWDRAQGTGVVYNVYMNDGGGFDLRRPVASVQGQDHVVTGLVPGRRYDFMVRARDRSGEDGNTRTLRVIPASTEPNPEWRAVWVSRFEWTGGEGPAVAARLGEMMKALGDGNFNAVIFQVRGQGDTLYPSRIEPWSPMLSPTARAIDPVAVAMREARRNGLEFHAWLNLSVIWQNRDHAPPADASHPYWRWANPRDRNRALGAVWEEPARPMGFGADNYVWLTAGNPELEAYLRGVVVDFLDRYPADGLHFDDRTALPHGASYDPVSRKRFAGAGNPDGIREMQAWQHDQLGRMMTNIYVQVTAMRPNLLVTASPFGIADKTRVPGYGRFKDARRDFGTDAEEWLAAGVLDALTPQIYWAEGDPTPNYGDLVRDWLRHNRSGRPIWPGSALGDYGGKQPLVPNQQRYVGLTRALGAGGNTFFSYTAATPREWAAASSTMYQAKARVPRPAHKAMPRTGQVMGVVSDANGKPVVDAWIRLAGRRYTYLSSGDGFYGIPNVAPGPATIEIGRPGQPPRRQAVQVTAGRTVRLDWTAH